VRVLAVVDRYPSPPDSPAGARCRELSTRLVRRGHTVEVLAGGEPGADPDVAVSDDGVVVRQFPLPGPRAAERSGRDGSRPDPIVPRRAPPARTAALPARTAAPKGSVASLQAWLSAAGSRFDVVVFFDHQALVTQAGLAACAGRVATVLNPIAAEGAALSRSVFESTLRMPTVHAYLDAEEEAVVARRLGRRPRGAVIGTGVDLAAAGDGARFRRTSGLGGRAYLLLLGPSGAAELRWWDRETRRRADLPAMVVLDDAAPAWAAAGREDAATIDGAGPEARRAALAGALAVVRPSCYDGSWSALAEARAEGRAAIVNGRWPAAVADARRTRAAVVYRGRAEFVAAVDLLLEDEDLRRSLGAAGQRHVQLTEHWDVVTSRYERLLWVAQNHR
jgi:hypothetical protein